MPPSIFDFITTEANRFETDEVQVGDNMNWNFRNHVQMIFHLKNGYFFTGNNDYLRAFKNIMEPILELAYWTEDIELKDVAFYLEGMDDKFLSLLLKKYHDEVYVKEHDLDKLFDDITESDIDFGGVLVQEGKDVPEVLPLQTVAFCDQTDILGGAMGFRFYFSPSKLKSMASFGWGNEKNGATISIDNLIMLATSEKSAPNANDKKKNKVPTKTIEVYIVRGDLPEAYLKDNDNMEDYSTQLQIVAFYVDEKNNKVGVTLYRKEANEDDLLFFTSKEVYGRALGRGIGERLIHPQIWTNFLEIHKNQMLQSGAKNVLYTDDPSYTNKSKIDDMENNEITTIEDGKRIYTVPTLDISKIQIYSGDINTWYQQAQSLGQANDPLLGKEAVSGTTFRGQERVVAQGRGSHNKRQGQRAKFIELIYRKMIIPDIKKGILKGKKFLATLSNEELTWVVDQVTTKLVNERIKELVLQGKLVTKEEQDLLTQTLKEAFMKKGNKHLLEILQKDFEDIEIRIGINVANKQKNLADLSDKLLNIFQFVFANPQAFMSAMQIPALAKSFENLLEFSGMSIGDFSSLLQAPPQANPAIPQTFTPTTPAPISPARVPQLALK